MKHAISFKQEKIWLQNCGFITYVNEWPGNYHTCFNNCHCEDCPYGQYKLQNITLIDWTAPLLVEKSKIKKENNRYFYIHSLLKNNFIEEYNEMVKRYGKQNIVLMNEDNFKITYKCYFDNYKIIDKQDLI